MPDSMASPLYAGRFKRAPEIKSRGNALPGLAGPALSIESVGLSAPASYSALARAGEPGAMPGERDFLAFPQPDARRPPVHLDRRPLVLRSDAYLTGAEAAKALSFPLDGNAGGGNETAAIGRSTVQSRSTNPRLCHRIGLQREDSRSPHIAGIPSAGRRPAPVSHGRARRPHPLPCQGSRHDGQP